MERYKRHEKSVEEALIEMYLAGVSVRRIEDLTKALWGTKVSPSTVSELNKNVHVQIEAWRNRELKVAYPCRWLLPGWQPRAHAGVRPAQARIGFCVGREDLPEHAASLRA